MERRAFRVSGFLVVLVVIGAVVATIWFVKSQAGQVDQTAASRVGWVVGGASLFVVLCLSGLTVLSPNEARVVQFFGKYVGSITQPGFHWTVPLSTKRLVSLRVRNFETNRLKVSDADGNPVEIAAVVVFRVVDSARAVFSVDDYGRYVTIQAEAAVRHLATSHPYESLDDERISLRDGTQVSDELTAELRERVELAGVEVVESRVTHLAYAPEIAQVMLQRQQANAVVAARSRIVDGAVGMVRMALDRLRTDGVVDLDEERKAQMVSNLLVVLCGDRATQPVVNTGTLYS
jgi:regulator of protease activity HflC (stomatin/prohibitin superfamily)